MRHHDACIGALGGDAEDRDVLPDIHHGLVGIDLALHVLHDEVRGEACRVFSELKKLFAEKLFHAGGDAFVGRVMG